MKLKNGHVENQLQFQFQNLKQWTRRDHQFSRWMNDKSRYNNFVIIDKTCTLKFLLFFQALLKEMASVPQRIRFDDASKSNKTISDDVLQLSQGAVSQGKKSVSQLFFTCKHYKECDKAHFIMNIHFRGI
jgi:hypothetical protein